MQTSIDRSHRHARKRRPTDSHPSLDELLRRTEWLTWPLIHWAGPTAAPNDAAVPSLHRTIVQKLRASPAGLYALQPLGAPDDNSDDPHLLVVTGQRLASATHALILSARVAKTSPHESAATRQQRQARLRLLNRCLHEPPGSRPFRQIAWLVTSTEAQPPADIAGQLGKHPELAQAGAGPAIMEYVLRTGPGHLAPFAEALRTLLAEAQSVDDEPTRRRGLFCSLLKEAQATQPAFFQLIFENSRGASISKWKPNPAFVKTALELFFRDYLPTQVARAFTPELRKSFTFEKMSAWVVGVELPAFQGGPLRESPHPPDVLAPMLDALGEIPPAATTPSQIQFLTMAARCAAITSDVEILRHAAAWLSACRQVCHAATPGLIWDFATQHLHDWVVASQFEKDNLRQLFGLLAARSLDLVAYGWIRRQSPPPALQLLARLGSLTPESALALIDLDLLDPAHKYSAAKPHHLSPLLPLIVAHRRRWLDLSEWKRENWFRLFSETHAPALRTLLRRWIDQLIRARGFTLHDVSSFLSEIVSFLATSDTTSARAARETFLAQHFGLLDRLLDEVELTLSALPATGLDDWRSHRQLWERRFGVVELLHQWCTTRYPGGAVVLDTLLAWCRQQDRIAIEKHEPHAPYHFCSASAHEAVLVHLSQGDPRYLQALLEYYVEPWAKPDDPFDGWLFLDRYPAVQQALHELCRRPGCLRGTIRILRRLALAVRLQCRAFLHARLDAWMAALAHPEPLASLRAFGRVAGYSDPLPSSIECVLARKENLTRERDHLSRLHAEGLATASAQRRLAKLDRLLAQPAAIQAWVEKDCRRLVTKRLPLVKVTALATITRQAVRAHWQQTVDRQAELKGRDWDNALHYYYSAEQNKDVLRQLLRHTARRDRHWPRQHPPNANFLTELHAHGYDADIWLAPLEMSLDVHGEKWTVHLEQNPLRVLQMGNLFDTCLSVEHGNAFAAIANAAEINKQVLYVENSRGAVIGRKLVGLTPAGRLFGFYSYGAGCLHDLDQPDRPHVWIKILLDLACLEIVRRLQGHFDHSPDPTTAAEQLRLSAEWYNDGPERFDWWITRPSLTQPITTGDKETVALAVLHRIHHHGLDLTDHNQGTLETLRALLWLGDDAALVVESLGARSFPQKCARFLHHQTSSVLIKSLLATD